jgi:hypothetical protein
MNKIIYLFIFLTFISCSKDDEPVVLGKLQLSSIRVGTVDLELANVVEQIPIDKGIVAAFNLPLDKESIENAVTLTDINNNVIGLSYAYLDNDKTVVATPSTSLINNTEYLLQIGEVKSNTNEVFPGADYSFKTVERAFDLLSASVNGIDLLTTPRVQNIPTNFNLEVTFSEVLSAETIFSNFIKIGSLDLNFQLSVDRKKITITPLSEVTFLKRYLLNISSSLKSEQGYVFDELNKEFYTQLDSIFKYPEITDDELLTKIQEQTFKYFWDFGHPVSGLARERNSSGSTVTIGGSGFGVMAILVGIERNFITRQEGIDRLESIVNFLETADRFHGVWPHWMDGNTGKVIPFSTDDNGGDLVETAFMIQGLLTARQYLNGANAQELAIKTKITTLWETVEWDWYTQGGQNVLYWHWSPNYEWKINHKIQGWNEALIVYVLAASSLTHPISADVYHQGWARSGAITNGNSFYNITLPLGSDLGGPLFFAHYSFLGLDPRNLEDQYANYWTQNVNHSLINKAYCMSNPLNYVGYAATSWGLTASDNNNGYSAHSPANDLGVISPTAAISSLPYTPVESIAAIRHFYYLMGDKLWGQYGFYDAYSVTADWYASSNLAIDQGPIINMIENHRTGLLWNLFMADFEVQAGLDILGFTY